MKISVVTVCYNAAETIADTLASVQQQEYTDVEHLIIDGGSTDATLEIVDKFRRDQLIVVSEPDNGMYDAMNKGLQLASGELVQFLNSDDFLADQHALSIVAECYNQTGVDCVFANTVIASFGERPRVHRFYAAPRFAALSIRWGNQPPHPSSFIRRSTLLKAGGFNTNFRIAADGDLFIRLLLVEQMSHTRLNRTTTTMRVGGLSSSGYASTKVINDELDRSLRANGFWCHPILVWSKYLFKWLQLVKKPKLPALPSTW